MPSPCKLDHLKNERAVFTRKTTNRSAKKGNEGQQNPLVWTIVFDSPFGQKQCGKDPILFACMQTQASCREVARSCAKDRALVLTEQSDAHAPWCERCCAAPRVMIMEWHAWCEVMRRVYCKHAPAHCQPALTTALATVISPFSRRTQKKMILQVVCWPITAVLLL